MSYLAIARKYRPATFDEIVGQRHVTRTLTNAIENDRIHHAYLFTGARGVGKTTAARALARALNCVNGPTVTPCGACPSCLEVGLGSSPDLIEIDGASNNSVDDVREIRDAVQYAPTRGRRKIYLIDEVHMLSKGAFNALLKTLEEPPPHIVFIFATTEPNKIPDTILSRVQRFDFKRIALPEVVERLGEIAAAEGVQIGPSGLRLIARAGEGSMRDAQSLLDQVIAAGGGDIPDAQIQETLGLIDQSTIHRFLRGLIGGDPAPCLEVIDHVYGYGHELSVFTSEALELLRHATFLRLSPQSRRFVDLAGDEIEALDAMTASADPEHLSRLFQVMLDVHDQVSRASRPRIVLEMAVARLAAVRPAQPLAALLDRVEQLERSLRAQAPPPDGRGRPPRADAPPRAPERSPRPAASRTGSRDPQEPSPASPTDSAGPQRPAPSARTPSRGAPPTAEPTAVDPPPWALAGPPADDEAAHRAAERSIEDDGPPWGEPPHAPDDAWALAAAGARPLAELSLATPATVRKRAPAGPRPSPTSPSARWQALCDDLRAVGPELEPLLQAEPILEGARLRLRFPPGRAIVAARRVVDHPAVARALVARYPAGVALELETAARGANAPADASHERAAREDPALQRILGALRATIERVDPPPPPQAPTEEPSP